MKWTSRDKYPCYGCEKRTPGCQDRCQDMREAKERASARKAIDLENRKVDIDCFKRNRGGRYRKNDEGWT